MPIGDRSYQLASSPDVRAEGPPFVQACFLLTDYAYDLLSTLLRWKVSLDEASGEDVLLVASGDSDQSGASYKRFRTASKERADRCANAEYRTALKEMVGTASAETHLNVVTAHDIASQLGVEVKQLPCIVWRTYPDMRPPLVIWIKPSWCRDDAARNNFAKALSRWLEIGRYRTLMDGTHSVGTFRRHFKAHLRRLAARIDRSVGSKRTKPKVPSRPRISAILRFEALEDETLRRPHPAELDVRHAGDKTTTKLTQPQLFYFTAFLFLGKKRQMEHRAWMVVDEDELAERLEAWRDAGLRTLGGNPPDKAQHRIMKEWPRFVESMHNRIGTEGWFDKTVYGGGNSGRHCYRLAMGVVTMGIASHQREWLRSVMMRLTGKP